jgi:hypothetical protein
MILPTGLRSTPITSPISSPTPKIEESSYYSPLQQISYILHPLGPSHRLHICGTQPPPASRTGQPEQATWSAELRRDGGDGRRLEGAGGAQEGQSELMMDGGSRFGDQGRATAGISTSPSCPAPARWECGIGPAKYSLITTLWRL